MITATINSNGSRFPSLLTDRGLVNPKGVSPEGDTLRLFSGTLNEFVGAYGNDAAYIASQINKAFFFRISPTQTDVLITLRYTPIVRTSSDAAIDNSRPSWQPVFYRTGLDSTSLLRLETFRRAENVLNSLSETLHLAQIKRYQHLEIVTPTHNVKVEAWMISQREMSDLKDNDDYADDMDEFKYLTDVANRI